jgi:ribonuclease VapC
VILDSSAVLAVVRREAGWRVITRILAEAPEVAIGAPTLVEIAIVAEARLGVDGAELAARFVDDYGVVVVEFGDAHWIEAHRAFARFGKGRHAAALNFGDCLTYAVAKVAAQPLLCVGDDFPQTDLALVMDTNP